jgi:uncharacterized protein YceH (UPF0502 family)
MVIHGPPNGYIADMIEGTMNLSAEEIRVLGCLLEKQRTTPDMYPLTLNALRLACNQSTNRDPVVGYDDRVIRDALHRLERRGFTRLASGRSSRAPKYRHLLADALPMGAGEQALMCVLMLRGTQTPGELKQRAERMHAFAGLEEVQATLERLAERGLVARLDRRPGQKEERYAQLLGDRAEDGVPARGLRPAGATSDGDPEPGSSAQRADLAPAGGDPTPSLHERVAKLEREVADLRAGRDSSAEALSSNAVSVMGE